MKALSNLAQSVRASTTLAIDTQFNKLRSEGIDVIGFSVGQPDFPTPEHIKQAGIRAIQENLTKYTPTPGTPAVRKAVADRLDADWGLDYTPEEIGVSGGGKPILYVALKTLIDPGDEAGRILQVIEDDGVDVKYILLTHGHYDHTGAMGELQAKWPETPVYLNRRDVYADACTQQLFPLLSGDVRDYDEGDTVAVGGLTVTVLATPGHSEGSVTLRCQDALFCGDTLFAGSCGRTDFPGGSMEKMMASLRRLGQLEGDLRVLPGHMEASTLDRERRWNPYLLQAMQ